MTLNFESYLQLASFIQCWGSKPGLRACYTSMFLNELYQLCPQHKSNLLNCFNSTCKEKYLYFILKLNELPYTDFLEDVYKYHSMMEAFKTDWISHTIGNA